MKQRATAKQQSMARTADASEVGDLMQRVCSVVLPGIVPMGDGESDFTQDQNKGKIVICSSLPKCSPQLLKVIGKM